MEINFKVSNLDISYTRPENRIINDSINYLEAVFCFEGEIWEKHNVIKTVIFENKDASLSVVLEGDSCYIPFEVLKSTGFKVGVKGTYTEADTSTTVHTDYCIVRTERSCCVDKFDNDLTPPQYEQLMALISSIGKNGNISIVYDSTTENLQISVDEQSLSDEQIEALENSRSNINENGELELTYDDEMLPIKFSLNEHNELIVQEDLGLTFNIVNNELEVAYDDESN